MRNLKGGFQVNKKDRKKHNKTKRDLQKRLKNNSKVEKEPVLKAGTIHYELSERIEGINCGGIGAIHMLAKKSGLIETIDREIHQLKEHKPYHESDHIMSICYNIIVGGHCLQDMEQLRENPEYMNSLDAERIPAPTTAGDFLRRFQQEDIEKLMDVINGRRVLIWPRLSQKMREKAIINIDATIEETTGKCKKGMALSYDGRWGYAPLIVSLANTREVLFLENRSGNIPSGEGAAKWIDKSIALTKDIFSEVWVRGDTDYSHTRHFDRWTDEGVYFVFGFDAKENLCGIAAEIPSWDELKRPEKYVVKTTPRNRPEKVKEQIVWRKGYKNFRLEKEEIAEFEYRPTLCKKDYRMVVLKKTISVTQRQTRLPDEIRYFFYTTNDRTLSTEEVVFFSNERCDHENDIEQLRNGVKALKMPTGDMISNWAYMLIASLAWTLKAWMGILMPHKATGYQILRMEFRRFLSLFILIPAQVLRKGRQLCYRIIGFMRHAPAFFGFVELCSNLRL
jgi:hypothetical protein